MYFLTTKQSVYVSQYAGSKLFVKQFVSSEGTKGNLALLAQIYRTIWHRNKQDGCVPGFLKFTLTVPQEKLDSTALATALTILFYTVA